MACQSSSCREAPKTLTELLGGIGVPSEVLGVLGDFQLTQATMRFGISLLQAVLYYSIYDDLKDQNNAITSQMTTMADDLSSKEDEWRDKDKLALCEIMEEYPEADVSGDEEYIVAFNNLQAVSGSAIASGIVSEDNTGARCKVERFNKRQTMLSRHAGYVQGTIARDVAIDKHIADKFSTQLSALSFAATQSTAVFSSLLRDGHALEDKFGVALTHALSGTIKGAIGIYDSLSIDRSVEREPSPLPIIETSRPSEGVIETSRPSQGVL